MKKSQSGFTLVEIMIVALLLGILGTIIVSVIVHALRASARNQANIRCKDSGKLVIETIEKELAMAAPVQYYSMMPSGVILPSAYSTSSSLGKPHFFSTVTGEQADANWRWSTDRVIFSELNTTSAGAANFTSLGEYNYVELMVERSAETNQLCLMRRVYKSSNGGSEGVTQQSGSNDLGPDLGYFVEGNLYSAAQTLMTLPNPHDILSFEVRRKAGYDTFYGTGYQRNLLYVTVWLYMTMGNEELDWHPSASQNYKNFLNVPKFILSTTVNTK